MYAQTLDQMLIGRILQGMGSGGCFTLGTAIIFDAFQKKRAIEATNSLNTIIPIIMSGAPMLGGYLNQAYGFRSNFLAIAVSVLISLLICIFFFDETLPKEKRTPLQAKAILRDFKKAFSSLAFWQLTAVVSLLFGGYIAFLSGTSVLFVVEFGMSKSVFPFMQAAILGGWVVGSLLLNRAIAKKGIPAIKKVGVALCMIGAVGLAAVSLIAPRDPYLQTICMVLYAFGANWIIGLYFPEGMEILPDIKGTTASLLTSARLLVAAAIVKLSSLLYNSTVYPLAAIVLGTMVLILPTLLFYEKRRPKNLTTANPSEPMHF
jgi:DHA1 family bicyclomycin/chloramphenicol resistance-like MFS transporter